MRRLHELVDRAFGDRIFAAQQRQTINKVLQLANISAPGHGHQLRDSPIVDFAHGQTVFCRHHQEMLRKQADVFGAVAQRWHLDGDDVQAVEQILTKPALFNQGGQVLVGRRDDADIKANARFSANAANDAALQRAQKTGLSVHWHVANFVEE